MEGLRKETPKDVAGWMRMRHGRFGKRRWLRLKGVMLYKHRSPEEEAEWSCSMLNCEILVHAEKLRIHIPKWRLLFMAESAEAFEMWVKALTYAASRIITNHYELLEKIGQGTSGTVRRAKCKESGEIVAVKVVKKEGLSQERLNRLQSEATIMMVVRSPQIVSTLDIFDEENCMYVVMEFLKPGTLDECIERRGGHVTEEQVRMIMNELLYGLAALHSLRIVHRDVKLENILCSFESFPLGTKLVDFGFGAIIPDSDDINQALSTMLGSWCYVSPEQVLRKPYGPSVDMWAAGVVMYRLLAGRFPFESESPNKIMRLIRNGSLTYGPEWNTFSASCRDFISRLLEMDAEARITAEEALAHPWLCGDERSLSLVQEDPLSEQLRTIQEVIRYAKLMIRGAAPLDARDSPGLSPTDPDLRGATAPDVSTSPFSIFSDKEPTTKKKPNSGKGAGILLGMQRGFTPPSNLSNGWTPSPQNESSLQSSPDEPSGFTDSTRRRRGKLTESRNFACEDMYMNGGDWI